jgi:hypothetical protein
LELRLEEPRLAGLDLFSNLGLDKILDLVGLFSDRRALGGGQGAHALEDLGQLPLFPQETGLQLGKAGFILNRSKFLKKRIAKFFQIIR